MTIADIERQIPDKAIGAVRNTYIFAALAGIVLGIILLVWPAATIDVAGILLGLGLIASGLFRLYESFAWPPSFRRLPVRSWRSSAC